MLIIWLLSGACNVLNPARLKFGLDNYHLKEDSRIRLSDYYQEEVGKVEKRTIEPGASIVDSSA